MNPGQNVVPSGLPDGVETVTFAADGSAGWALAWAPAAHAAIKPCTKTQCSYVGGNPEATGCSVGAYAVGNVHVVQPSDNAPAGALNLMYSPACNTNWAEADSYAADWGPVDIVAWNTVNPAQSKRGIANYGGYAFTPMVNGSFDAGACIKNYRLINCIGQRTITSHPGWGDF